jgi:RNA recognition motif-containing protein
VKVELRAEFSKFGEVLDLKIKTRQDSNNSFCFIEYGTIDEAEKAIQ